MPRPARRVESRFGHDGRGGLELAGQCSADNAGQCQGRSTCGRHEARVAQCRFFCNIAASLKKRHVKAGLGHEIGGTNPGDAPTNNGDLCMRCIVSHVYCQSLVMLLKPRKSVFQLGHIGCVTL